MNHRMLIAAVMICVVITNTKAKGHDLENAWLRLQVDDRGRVTIHDKRAGVTWLQVDLDRKELSNRDEIPEVTSVEASAGELAVHLKWRIPLVCRWSLSGPDNVGARLEALEESAAVAGDGRWNLLYPPPCLKS